MDLTNFWEQLFSPLNNIISIFFIVLITVLSERIVKEMEKAERFKAYRNPDNLLKNLLNFTFRFMISFLLVLILVFFIIIFLSLFLAVIGLLINYFLKF